MAIPNHECVGNHPSVYEAYLQMLNAKTAPLRWATLKLHGGAARWNRSVKRMKAWDVLVNQGVIEGGRRTGQTEGSLEAVAGEPSRRSPCHHRKLQSSVCPWGAGKGGSCPCVAPRSGRDHVCDREYVHSSCCHGGIAGGEQCPVAASRGRGAGDAAIAVNSAARFGFF